MEQFLTIPYFGVTQFSKETSYLYIVAWSSFKVYVWLKVTMAYHHRKLEHCAWLCLQWCLETTVQATYLTILINKS